MKVHCKYYLWHQTSRWERRRKLLKSVDTRKWWHIALKNWKKENTCLRTLWYSYLAHSFLYNLEACSLRRQNTIHINVILLDFRYNSSNFVMLKSHCWRAKFNQLCTGTPQKSVSISWQPLCFLQMSLLCPFCTLNYVHTSSFLDWVLGNNGVM